LHFSVGMWRRHSFLVVVCCFLGLVSGACAAHHLELQDLPSEPLAGHVTADAAGTWFTPCGSAPEAARWWVTLTGASVQQMERAKSSGLLAAGGRTFVRWSAARTDGRHIGPGGPALLVRDITEVRAAGANDCALRSDSQRLEDASRAALDHGDEG
jgi:hypothetical protein